MNKEEFLKQDKLINQVYKDTEDYGRMQFVREIVKLQNNWNELKEWLEDENNQQYSKYIYNYSINNWVLNKMQEIEGGVDNE